MSHFYGVLKGNRGTATRCGTKASGVNTIAASWSGAIHVSLYVDTEGRDCFIVEQLPWHGSGVYQRIAEGVLGEKTS